MADVQPTSSRSFLVTTRPPEHGSAPPMGQCDDVHASTHAQACLMHVQTAGLQRGTRMWASAVPLHQGDGWSWHEYTAAGPQVEPGEHRYAVTTIRPDSPSAVPQANREFAVTNAALAPQVAADMHGPGTRFWLSALAPVGCREWPWAWTEFVVRHDGSPVPAGPGTASPHDEAEACIRAGARLMELIHGYLKVRRSLDPKWKLDYVQYITDVDEDGGVLLKWEEHNSAGEVEQEVELAVSALDLADPAAGIEAMIERERAEIDLLKKLVKKHPKVAYLRQ